MPPGDHETWEFKRDRRVRLPLDEVTWSRDGVHHLRPEVQLLLKARGLRPRDQLDFEAVLPLLSRERAAWLGDALALVHPGHRWLDALTRSRVGTTSATRPGRPRRRPD